MRRVFALADRNATGAVTITDLGAVFAPDRHPHVVAGLETQANVRSDFLTSLDELGVMRGGAVDEEALQAYYKYAGAFLDDATFLDVMGKVWPRKGGGGGGGGALGDHVAGPKQPGHQYVDDVLERLRAEFARRGARGIVGLQRKFRIIDDDGSKSLDYDEFAKCLKETGLGLNPADAREGTRPRSRPRPRACCRAR